MNNHQDWAYNSPSPHRHISSPSPTTQQKVISTLLLLTLGYYVLNFFNIDFWPSTTKRRLFECFVLLIPNHLIYGIEHLMHRFGRLPYDVPLFNKEDFGNQHAKIRALQRMIGDTNSPVRGVMRKARTFSGLDNVFRSSGERGPPGLGNWDNSCYQNSVLQGFASLPAFTSSIRQMSERLSRSGDSGPTHEALEGFLEELNELSERRRVIWTPDVLKSMDSWQQQDAQEYFSRVLDEVEKEAFRHQKRLIEKPGLENIRKRKFEDFAGLPQGQTISVADDLETDFESRTSVSSPARDAQKLDQSSPTNPRSLDNRRLPEAGTAFRNPLDGMLAQGLECLTCGFTEGLSFTQFNCLTVNLGDGGSGTIEELMEEYVEPEEIEGVECSNCTKIAQEKLRSEEKLQGSDTEKAPTTTKTRMKPVLCTKSKQITVGRLPTDLVIHINRSIFDMYGNQRKNTSRVGFPLRLEFLNRWCPQIDSTEEIQRVYELKCAVTHYGRHENGHYIAYGKRDKDWYCFNDDIVTRVDLEEVLNAGNVFMLFYEAIDEALAPDQSPEPELPVISEESETAMVDDVSSASGASRSPSTSGSSDPAEEVYAPAVEPEMALPVMRTATSATHVLQQSDLVPSSVVQAL